MIRLVIRDVEGGEASFPVTGEVVIGRSRECQIRFEDPSVSRRHARVFLDYGDAVIEDLGSPNGTLVNRQRVAGPQRLKTGDSIQIGTEKIRVIETSPLEDFAASTEVHMRAQDARPIEESEHEGKSVWDDTLPFDRKADSAAPARPAAPPVPAVPGGNLKWMVIGGAAILLVVIAWLVLTQ